MPESLNQTRQALLDAAERLFSSRGYAAVGTREIAEQAGVNLASIKYHFGSKHDLYLETVRRAMGHYDSEALSDVLRETPKDRAAAAAQLVAFIRAFFARLAQHPEMDSCGLLMVRESLQPSEAIDAVVRDYLKLRTEDLIAVLRVLVPDASDHRLSHLVHLLLGQMMHFRIFRPFIERLNQIDLADETITREIARQVAVFSLRGLECDEMMIKDALEREGMSTNRAPGDRRT